MIDSTKWIAKDMAKNEESLRESRKIRTLLKQRWGNIPGSIIRAKWDESIVDTSVSYQDGRQTSEYAGTPFDLSGVGARHGQLSRFPTNVAQFAARFYTPERLEEGAARYFGNDLPTVIDPFAGHDSRMSAVFRTSRNYLARDISAEYMRMNREIRDKLLLEEGKGSMLPTGAQIELVEGDSRDIDYLPVFDFCLSSPPFWNLETYTNEAGQLGHLSTYNFFLDDLEKIAANCYRALKPGAFLAWELNDFTKDGIFHPYAFDMMQRFKRIGFLLHQVIIIDYGQGFLQSFASDMEVHHLVSKEHAYLVVVRKHSEKASRAERRIELSKEADIALREGRIEHQSAFTSIFTEIDFGSREGEKKESHDY